MSAPRPWRTILASVGAAYGVALVACIGFAYSGTYDVAATEPHWPLTHRILEIVRLRSIETHAEGIAVPPGLDDPMKISMGVEHFAAHCAVCHGAPGVPRGDIAAGMYPLPPDLGDAAKRLSDAELFRIVKYGIKMTGMPNWKDHGDDELWATVAFLKTLPGMSEADYAKLIVANMSHGAMHHPAGAAEGQPARQR